MTTYLEYNSFPRLGNPVYRFQRSGESTIAPGCWAVSRTSSACRITVRCVFLSLAGPSGAPSGKCTKSVRGGFTFWATSRRIMMQTVEIPDSSSTRAISSTDCWQIGQQGTSRAASAPAVNNRLAAAGAVISISYRGWGKNPEKLIAGSTKRPIIPSPANFDK